MTASDRPLLDNPAWSRARTLAERHGVPRVSDPDRAARRLRRWRSQAAFAGEDAFARRLAADGLTEEALAALLGEPAEALRERLPETPDWLRELDAAAATWTGGPVADPLAELPGLIEAVVARACERLRAGARRLADGWPDAPFDADAIDALLAPNLVAPLGSILTPTLVLELQVARLEGRLDGDTPEARYGSFVAQMHRPDRSLALLEEYPVLARLATTCVEQWLRYGLEFLGHLRADWPELRASLAAGLDPGRLIAIDAGSGDRHRGGRSVLVTTFESGLRLVYKPRSLAAERHFQELLAWLNQRGANPPFRTLALLDRGDHGWVEFIEAHACTTPAEIARFYRRQGGYLALLRALAATDLHFENLIAAGEHPVLIDGEALFHVLLGGRADAERDDPAGRAIEHSVLWTSLLPHEWGPAAGGYDISGLTAPDELTTPFTVPVVAEAGSDAMRLVRRQVSVGGGQHRPSVAGVQADARSNRDALVAGFTDVYRLLERHRDDLLAADGPLAVFAEDEVRVIPRSTQEYASLLQASMHPDVLRDALDRERLLDHLWSGVRDAPHLARLITAERRDLSLGDVPIFTTRPGERDVWDSHSERITGLIAESGLDVARRRIAALGASDLARQVWFIDNALGTRPRPPVAPRDPDRRLALARAAGDRLAELAVADESGVTWVGLATLGPDRCVPAPLSIDLYDGLPGVVLFLAYLGDVTGETRYHTLARGGLASLRRAVARERERGGVTGIGAFDGWGGPIYALAHLGTLWSEPALLAEAEGLVPHLQGLIERDEQHDIIAGAAGAIGALLALHHVTGSAAALSAAVACGDHLIAAARPMAQGRGWHNGDAPQALTGFAHGAAGIAWALEALAARTGAERFRHAAAGGIAYERSLFAPGQDNWPDLRDRAVLGDSDDGPAFMTAWCHGAPGIGLARAQGPTRDRARRDEIAAARRATLTHGFGGDLSLCHGDLGNLECLRAMSRTGDGDETVARVAHATVERIAAEGWRCGTPGGLGAPGLMTGVAGIGYGLLRLVAPDRVPCVLTLAPPQPGGRSR